MLKAFYKNKIIKKVTSLLNNRITLVIIIPVILLSFWVVLSYFYIASKTGVSVLTYPAHVNNYTSWKTTELLKGQKVEEQFVARENHLGIVAVRFNTYRRINKDSVIFRIKEKGAKDWYYENSYLVDQFQPNQYFTFGMPIINNSFGKTYQFEIESVRGKLKDAVALSPKDPVFVTKYQFPRHEILSDKKVLAKFIIMKTTESLADKDFIASSIIYLLPFLFYVAIRAVLILLNSYKEYLKDKLIENLFIYAPLYIILLGVLITVVLAKTVYPLMIFIVLALWIITIVRYKFESRVTLSFGGLFLLIAPFLFLYSSRIVAQNTAIWAYVFLSIGVTQQLFEYKPARQKVR